MNDAQIARIRRFIGDKETQETIKAVIQSSFLGRREGDVHKLAAQMLAMQFLTEAWAEMERYRQEPKREEKPTNPGM